MGLQGMQIEENAKHLRANLAGLQSHLQKFADPFEKLGTHLKNAAQSYAEADKRFERAESSVESMLAGDSVPQIASEPQAPLNLPAASKQSA
jgi:DNA anti-recombination protein RmuC